MQKKPNKTIIILESGAGNRLANQLWNFSSIYAYCLEKNYKCYNFSFFEEKKHKNDIIFYTFSDYNHLFNIPLGFFIKILNYIHLKNNKIIRKIKPYNKYVQFIKLFKSKQIIISGDTPFYLPPSVNKLPEQINIIKKIESDNNFKFYFSGWLFRNPVGLKKYHKEIVEFFKPNKETEKKVKDFIDPLREKYTKIIGVHIRQQDYKTYAGGKYYFSPFEVREILDEYLKESTTKKQDTIFVLCSDEKININIFSGLNIIAGPGKLLEDLLTLSKTDMIIGSNSTFGAFAAYYGNIPIIVFNRNKINWDKFNGQKKEFNYDNDCTTVHL